MASYTIVLHCPATCKYVCGHLCIFVSSGDPEDQLRDFAANQDDVQDNQNFVKSSFVENRESSSSKFVDLNDADVIYSQSKKSTNSPSIVGKQQKLSFN